MLKMLFIIIQFFKLILISILGLLILPLALVQSQFDEISKLFSIKK